MSIAAVTKDKTICANIQDNAKKSNCEEAVDYEVSKDNPKRYTEKECKSYKDPVERDQCYLQLGPQDLNPDYCGKINDAWTRDSCYMVLIYRSF